MNDALTIEYMEQLYRQWSRDKALAHWAEWSARWRHKWEGLRL